MKTELAAYGINLVAATRIFLVDPLWDSAKESQAIKRAHRIGQTKEVFVEKLIMQHSIEEIILQWTNINAKTEETSSEITQKKIHLLLQSLKEVSVNFADLQEDLPVEAELIQNEIPIDSLQNSFLLENSVEQKRVHFLDMSCNRGEITHGNLSNDESTWLKNFFLHGEKSRNDSCSEIQMELEERRDSKKIKPSILIE